MRNLFLAFLISLTPLISSVTITGCSTGSQLTAVESIYAVQVSVDELMQAYGTAVALGRVSLDNRVKVRDQYRKYESLENKLITGLAFGTDLKNVSDAELADLAFDLTIFVLTLIN